MAEAAKALESWSFAFEDGRQPDVTSYAEIQTGSGAAACRRAAAARRFYAAVQRLGSLRC